MTIHEEHPFQLPPEQRDLGRRLRGRLAAGVTVLTAGTTDHPVGLTASSLSLVDGEPWRAVVVVSDTADFYDAVQEAGTFVMHGLETRHRALADRLAGLAPAPGGMFRDLSLSATDWGPHIEGLETWAGCRLESMTPVGYQHLLVGLVEVIGVHDLTDPLVYYRGRYRSLDPS